MPVWHLRAAMFLYGFDRMPTYVFTISMTLSFSHSCLRHVRISASTFRMRWFAGCCRWLASSCLPATFYQLRRVSVQIPRSRTTSVASGPCSVTISLSQLWIHHRIKVTPHLFVLLQFHFILLSFCQLCHMLASMHSGCIPSGEYRVLASFYHTGSMRCSCLLYMYICSNSFCNKPELILYHIEHKNTISFSSTRRTVIWCGCNGKKNLW